ncbi:MAG: hypothetical protein ACJAVZ_002293 [Afipia broomeae]|jgi:hypothetical protein
MRFDTLAHGDLIDGEGSAAARPHQRSSLSCLPRKRNVPPEKGGTWRLFYWWTLLCQSTRALLRAAAEARLLLQLKHIPAFLHLFQR